MDPGYSGSILVQKESDLGRLPEEVMSDLDHEVGEGGLF